MNVNNSRNFEKIENLRDFREIRSSVSITQPHAALRNITQQVSVLFSLHTAIHAHDLIVTLAFPVCFPLSNLLLSSLNSLLLSDTYHLCASVSRVFGVYVLYMSGLKPPLLSLSSPFSPAKRTLSLAFSPLICLYIFSFNVVSHFLKRNK